MEKDYLIKSETARSIMGRIPCLFLIKGIILATIILSAGIYILSVVKIPFYKELSVYNTSICNNGQMQGVVIIPKEWMDNKNGTNIRIKRIDNQNSARANVKDSISFGGVNVVYIVWPYIVEDTTADFKYTASIIEYQKSVLFCIFEPLMQNKIGVLI